MSVSVSFLVENALTALIIVAYLAYEIHWGRLSTMAKKMDEVIYAVIALARASPGVDEESVADRLNGHTPDDLMSDESRGKPDEVSARGSD